MTQIIQIPPSLRGHYAGFVTRFIAFSIDLLLVVITQITILLFVRVVLNFFGLDDLARAIFEPAEAPNSSVFISVLRWVIAVMGSAVVFAIYVITFWLLVDKTLGQAFLGLRVLRSNGRPITLVPAIKRLLGYYISFFALGLGFLWVLVDDRRQGWHDKIADTVVIYDWEARLGKRLREWLARQQESRRLASAALDSPTDKNRQG